MKKLISIVLIICLTSAFAPALAVDAQEATMATSLFAAGGSSSYIANVYMQVHGRAGWSSPDGAKGPVFEVVFKQMENLKDITKRGAKTSLSKSSTDPVADVVKTNAKGEILEQYQLKDGVSNSQVRKVAKQIKSNHYGKTKMVATKELAKECNQVLAKDGIEEAMINSNISTKTTSNIAEEMLQYTKNHKFTTTIKNCGKASGIGVLLGGVIGLAESLQKDDDLYETISNMTTSSADGAITMALYPVVVDGVKVFLTTAGTSAATTAAAPIVVGLVACSATGYVLYKAEEAMDIRTVLTNVLRKTGEIAVKAGKTVQETIRSADIPTHAKNITIKMIEIPAAAVGFGVGFCEGIIEEIKDKKAA